MNYNWRFDAVPLGNEDNAANEMSLGILISSFYVIG